jgi:hypothetical protein
MIMKPRAIFLAAFLCLTVAAAVPAVAQQTEPVASPPKTRDGVFQVTLKTPDARKMTVDELVRDRDLNPGNLYRVSTGGYLGFDEAEWVDKIEFKVFDLPVTDMPQYKRFAELLSEINDKAWAVKETLSRYDLLALRLMDICDRSRFSSLQAIDENVAQQLLMYKKLTLLRGLVVNGLNRFIKDRSCRDLFSEYQKSLDIYSRQLAELSKNFDLLSRRVLALSKDTTQPPAERITDPDTPAEAPQQQPEQPEQPPERQ